MTHRCTSWRGPYPGEFPPGKERDVKCENEATAFFIDARLVLWPRCETHSIGWKRGGEPHGPDQAREISREEYEVALVHES